MPQAHKKISPVSTTAFLENMAVSMGQPFAKALAVFVSELVKQNIISFNSGAVEKKGGSFPDRWGELPAGLREKYESEIRQNEGQASHEKLQPVELTQDSPAIAIANRIKQILREKGISQKYLAEKLKVNPSYISRVLKNPDRSKVMTLRKISNALAVDIQSVIS